MEETAKLRNLLKGGYPFEAKGHCRIDYTDPLTGKVLERIEGDNHVFIDQLLSTSFQTTALNSALVLTNGEQDVDVDFPFIPGSMIGYGTPDTAATGVYQGSYRRVDSYYNSIGDNEVTSLYVYDFLSTQVPEAIKYVGLHGGLGRGAGTTPFMFRWSRDNYGGMFDIERNLLFHEFTCSLSYKAGGAGSLYFYVSQNGPAKVAQRVDIFELCEHPDCYGYNQGAQARWGYDYENQHIILFLTRINRTERYQSQNPHYWYTFTFRDDIFVIDYKNLTLVKRFTYERTPEETTNSSWQYQENFWIDGTGYMRLYGDELYSFAKTNDQYVNVGARKWILNRYDITSGSWYGEEFTAPYDASTGRNDGVGMYSGLAYYYKGYFFGMGGNTTLDGSIHSSSRMYANNAVHNPIYNVYDDSVFSNVGPYFYDYYDTYRIVEKGQTSIYAKTWNRKPRFSNDSGGASTAEMPYCYTAYQLPVDAPVRPVGSAITIAYGLTVRW